MRSIIKNKKGQTGIQELPQFFQIIMLVIIIVGLTFIVLDKFISITTSTSSLSSASVTNETFTTVTSTETPSKDSEVYLFAITSVVATNATEIEGIVLENPADYNFSGPTIYFNGSGIYFGEDINVSYVYSYIANPIAHRSINESTYDLYNYGVAFLGVIILVVMVYLIINIISGTGKGPGRKGAR